MKENENQQQILNNKNNELKEIKREALSDLEKIKEKNKFYETNNIELKEDFSNYIIYSKKDQQKLNLIEKDNALNLKRINEKLKFHQDENVRLSSELMSVKKNNENIKVNLSDIETEKDKISNKIKELSKSIEGKGNIVSTDFNREKSYKEKTNIDNLTDKEQKSLDHVINKIFSKM